MPNDEVLEDRENILTFIKTGLKTSRIVCIVCCSIILLHGIVLGFAVAAGDPYLFAYIGLFGLFFSGPALVFFLINLVLWIIRKIKLNKFLKTGIYTRFEIEWKT
jgi:hypothetical protein